MTTERFNHYAGGLWRVLRPWFDGVFHLLWPEVCDGCGGDIDRVQNGLCNECWEGLQRCTGGDYCRRCGRDASPYGIIDGACGACQGITLQYDGIGRGGVYDGVLRDMILALKFHDRTELAGTLSLLTDSALEGSGFAAEVDYLVPVPLHWRRRLGRGYNQSMLLCSGLGRFAIPINTDLLRIRYTQRQWNLPSAERYENVKGAFAVRKNHDFSGKTICLVDDITTSGATLNECTGALKQAGATKVYVLVAAVAMQEMDWVEVHTETQEVD